MTDVVTRLVIRADGSLATLDRFEKGMGDAGKATDYASGAVTSFEKRMAAARTAMERGNAIATETVARKSAEQRAWERWSATVDKTTALRIRLEREAAQASAAAANAVNMGYATQEQALTTLMALERRHMAQLTAHIAAEGQNAASYRRTAAAADEAAAATRRAAAANDNSQYRGAANFNTANVAAQFQDIGVTAAMGMSPMMIALQQGTQLSAVLGGQGLTGVVKTLGAAFASILSPVSLITIGVVALAAVGIQAFMNMTGGAEDATTALERHNEWLDEVLAGYDKVRDAADSALEAAQRLPEASVASNLATRQAEAADRALAAMEKVLDLQGDFQAYAGYAEAFNVPDDVAASLEHVSDLIGKVTADASLSRSELDQLHVAFTELANNTADQNIRDIANEALALVDSARAAASEVGSVDAALRNLPRDVQIRISVSQVFSDAMADINSLYIDPRSRFDQAREELNLRAQVAQDSAQSMSELTALASDYKRVMESINAAEAEANEKAGARGAKAAQKPFDQWGGNVEQFQQRIASQRMELDLLGRSTYEIERQKAAFDLLNQAKQAGIPITSQVTDQINLMSSEYAAATVELQRMQEQQQAMDRITGALSSSFSSLFKDMIKGTKSAGDAIADLLGKLGDLFIDQAFNMLFGGMFGGGFGMGGGARGGLLGGAIIPGILHSGGTAGIDGYGHGRSFNPAIWANAPRYHNGTPFAGLRSNEVPAILERGERVIPANQNGNMAQTVVIIRLEDGLRADIVGEATGQAVQITKNMVEPVSRTVNQMAQQQRYG